MEYFFDNASEGCPSIRAVKLAKSTTLSPHAAKSSVENRPFSKLMQGGQGEYEREK